MIKLSLLCFCCTFLTSCYDAGPGLYTIIKLVPTKSPDDISSFKTWVDKNTKKVKTKQICNKEWHLLRIKTQNLPNYKLSDFYIYYSDKTDFILIGYGYSLLGCWAYKFETAKCKADIVNRESPFLKLTKLADLDHKGLKPIKEQYKISPKEKDICKLINNLN